MSAVLLVRKGWSVRQTARYIGVSPGTISKWVSRAPQDGRLTIPTQSSRPHTSPFSIPIEIERVIIAERQKRHRCGQVVHQELIRQGIKVSLSTVQRVLDRNKLTNSYSPWKKRHISLPRPLAIIPGDLVQLDTIHQMISDKKRIYIYTLIDVASRWAHALVSKKISAGNSLLFLQSAKELVVFPFQTIQSDHGPEFSSWFTNHAGSVHRHSRISKPNDNAHVERFNRTIQDECLNRLPANFQVYQKEIPEYLRYYNEERLHMGINYQTPVEKLNQLFPRS
ncbi:MAG: integrase core domain-containing protein [Patescibacteria group bacterium]